MDCLYAECKPCITDCVIAELEKLGQRYRVALKVAKVCALCICVLEVVPATVEGHLARPPRWHPASSVREHAGPDRGSAREEVDEGAVMRQTFPQQRAGVQDPRVERLPCMHSGTYADDCICERVRQHRCYIVATCDRDLRRRLRKARRAHPLLTPCLCTPQACCP